LTNECRQAVISMLRSIITALDDHHLSRIEAFGIGVQAFGVAGHLASLFATSPAEVRARALWILEHAVYAIPPGMAPPTTSTTTQEYKHE